MENFRTVIQANRLFRFALLTALAILPYTSSAPAFADTNEDLRNTIQRELYTRTWSTLTRATEGYPGIYGLFAEPLPPVIGPLADGSYTVQIQSARKFVAGLPPQDLVLTPPITVRFHSFGPMIPCEGSNAGCIGSAPQHYTIEAEYQAPALNRRSRTVITVAYDDKLTKLREQQETHTYNLATGALLETRTKISTGRGGDELVATFEGQALYSPTGILTSRYATVEYDGNGNSPELRIDYVVSAGGNITGMNVSTFVRQGNQWVAVPRPDLSRTDVWSEPEQVFAEFMRKDWINTTNIRSQNFVSPGKWASYSHYDSMMPSIDVLDSYQRSPQTGVVRLDFFNAGEPVDVSHAISVSTANFELIQTYAARKEKRLVSVIYDFEEKYVIVTAKAAPYAPNRRIVKGQSSYGRMFKFATANIIAYETKESWEMVFYDRPMPGYPEVPQSFKGTVEKYVQGALTSRETRSQSYNADGDVMNSTVTTETIKNNTVVHRETVRNFSSYWIGWEEGTLNERVVYDRVRLGDFDQNNAVNLADIGGFIAALMGGSYQAAADFNADGAVNGADIAGFVAALMSGIPQFIEIEAGTRVTDVVAFDWTSFSELRQHITKDTRSINGNSTETALIKLVLDPTEAEKALPIDQVALDISLFLARDAARDVYLVYNREGGTLLREIAYTDDLDGYDWVGLQRDIDSAPPAPNSIVQSANRVVLVGDMNDDGAINGADISGFVAALTVVPTTFTGVLRADIDGDGAVNGADISGFVALLNGASPKTVYTLDAAATRVMTKAVTTATSRTVSTYSYRNMLPHAVVGETVYGEVSATRKKPTEIYTERYEGNNLYSSSTVLQQLYYFPGTDEKLKLTYTGTWGVTVSGPTQTEVRLYSQSGQQLLSVTGLVWLQYVEAGSGNNGKVRLKYLTDYTAANPKSYEAVYDTVAGIKVSETVRDYQTGALISQYPAPAPAAIVAGTNPGVEDQKAIEAQQGEYGAYLVPSDPVGATGSYGSY